MRTGSPHSVLPGSLGGQFLAKWELVSQLFTARLTSKIPNSYERRKAVSLANLAAAVFADRVVFLRSNIHPRGLEIAVRRRSGASFPFLSLLVTPSGPHSE